MTALRNIVKKIWPVAKFAIAFLLLYFVIKITLIQLFMSMAEGKDVVAKFGGGKYELGKAGHYTVLEDYRFDTKRSQALVLNVEKYTIYKNNIYVVGDFTSSYCAKMGEQSLRPCRYLDFATGKYIDYKPGEPVPRYLILDFENDRLRTYMKSEDIPPEDQAVFEKAKEVKGAVEKRIEVMNRKLP